MTDDFADNADNEPEMTDEQVSDEGLQCTWDGCDYVAKSQGALNLHIASKHTKSNVKTSKEGRKRRKSSAPSPIEADYEEPSEDDEKPTFRSPETDERKRRFRLSEALEIFGFKPGDKKYIMNMWDNYEVVRNDDREFFDLIMELDKLTSRQAHRIVDMVFGQRDSQPDDFYHGRSMHSQRQPDIYRSRYQSMPMRYPRYHGYDQDDDYDDDDISTRPVVHYDINPPNIPRQKGYSRRQVDEMVNERVERLMMQKKLEELARENEYLRENPQEPQQPQHGRDPETAERMAKLETVITGLNDQLKKAERERLESQMVSLGEKYKENTENLHRELTYMQHQLSNQHRSGVGQVITPQMTDEARIKLAELEGKVGLIDRQMTNWNQTVRELGPVVLTGKAKEQPRGKGKPIMDITEDSIGSYIAED